MELIIIVIAAPWCMPGFWWCRHQKDPTCVVDEQRQFFHLALCLPELACDVGDKSKWEFFKSSKLNSAIFISQFISYRLIFGGFCSTFSSIFFLLPRRMNNYRSYWKWIPICLYGIMTSCNFLWYHKLFFIVKLFTNLTCRWNRKICFDWFSEWVVKMKCCYKVSHIIVLAISTFPISTSIEKNTRMVFKMYPIGVGS